MGGTSVRALAPAELVEVCLKTRTIRTPAEDLKAGRLRHAFRLDAEGANGRAHVQVSDDATRQKKECNGGE